MKRLLPGFVAPMIFVLMLFAIPAPAIFAEQAPGIAIRYYGDISCDHCDTFESITVPQLEADFGVELDVVALDIMRPEWRANAAELLAEFGQEFRIFPIVMIGNNAYQGHSRIERYLADEIAHLSRTGEFLGRITQSTEPTPAAPQSPPTDTPVLRYFWAEGCPACARAAVFLDELSTRYPALVIERHEVTGNRVNMELFRRTAAEYQTAASAVPAFFFANRYWVGFRQETVEEISAMVGAAIVAGDAGAVGPRAGTASTHLDLPLFGRVSLETLPAFAVTAAIAAVDGFNPCSLWVLTFLIGLIVRTGSRGRTVAVGLVFLGVTAGVYGLFMLGLFRVFLAASGLLAVRLMVAVLAVSMGVINMKDYFAFKVGFSLTIPQRFQSLIARHGRTVFDQSGSPLLLVATTALFALGISVVELPCTAGFPVIWSQYVASIDPGATTFWWLFALYLFVYLADEVIIVAASVILMRRVSFGETQARALKLLGGAIMTALGGAYLFAPEATRSMAGVGMIFGVALLFAATVLVIGRLLPNRVT